MKRPNAVYSGKWGKCHCQGIAVDEKNGFIYYSFTTKLVKCDLTGKTVGWADGITGHLGCIGFYNGKIYASLEYLNDEIGKGVLNALGIKGENVAEAFYVAVFDVDKITKPGMDAVKDGIMRATYLKTVVEDFYAKGADGNDHAYGCSGIDGITVGPDFGKETDGNDYLMVAYGIYSDLKRKDNDYQVILKYPVTEIDHYAQPLAHDNLHYSGPDNPVDKYFLYTGNTFYGVQNLEYDAYTGDYFACVYHGFKPDFPNYTLFVIDGKRPPETRELCGIGGQGKVLSLRNVGGGEKGIYGLSKFLGGTEFGSMGFFSFGDGYFYATDPDWSDKNNLSVTARLFRLRNDVFPWEFEEVR